MSFPRTHHRNWDEFRWEQEIRRDERRINCYFRTLPSCLDLPGEEEMVSSTIAAQGDLLPEHGSDQGPLAPWSYLAVNAEDDERDTALPEGRRPGEYIIETLDKLASQWNLHCAATPEIRYAGLTISCAYAKLLARCADFFDVPDGDNALKKCLGKRALGDLLELNHYLEMLTKTAPAEKGFADFQQRRVIGLREQLADFLSECK